MKLKRAMFWRRPAAVDTQPSQVFQQPTPSHANGNPQSASVDPSAGHSAKVIPLPVADAVTTPVSASATDELTNAPPQPARIQGLLNAPELEAFFNANQFGYGRHQGTRYRSAEALDRGLEAVIAGFQHVLADLAERRQAKIDRLRLARQKVAGLSPAMAGQLDLALEQTSRELSTLHEQAALAEQRKGWVLDALNRYRLGFDRGVRDVIEYELLGN